MMTQPLMLNGLLLASPLKRVMAFFIDFAFIYLVLFGIINLSESFRSLIDLHQRNMDDINFSKQIMRINDHIKFASFILWILIGTVMDSTIIQGTLGKLIVQIKVSDSNGNKISFQKAIIRNLCKIVSSIFFIGFISTLFDKKYQGFHDKIANTYVIDKVRDLLIDKN
jgi:uncharacterized RDD family membrane protein YckC